MAERRRKVTQSGEWSGPILIGVDGGGTKTEALVAFGDRIAGSGLSGSSNYQKVGYEAAIQSIERAIEQAWADARVKPAPPSAICLGLSGVDRAADEQMWADWLAGYAPDSARLVTNDCELALAAGTPNDIGLAVVCGTGSICVGRNPAGEFARSDGWGYILGDDGSGYSIGLAAMRAVLREYDGRGPATSLTPAILAAWELRDPEDLLVRVYIDEAMPADVAALTGVVNREAEAGDAVALQLLQNAGREMAHTMIATARQLRLENPIPCGLTGGVITKSALMRRFTLEETARAGLVLDPVEAVEHPAVGAVRLAGRLLTQEK